MGRLRRSRTHHARRDVKRTSRTRRRTKDLDQIQEDMSNPGRIHELKLTHPVDAELPGLGQHYCLECAKYFIDSHALDAHVKSKIHRRRLRDLKEEAHTQKHAEAAVGLTTENKRPLTATEALQLSQDIMAPGGDGNSNVLTGGTVERDVMDLMML